MTDAGPRHQPGNTSQAAQTQEVAGRVLAGARQAISEGYPAAAVIVALRVVADRLEGQD